MFDGIGAYGATQKPWTVAVSMAGQSVMIALAIAIPLVTTEALPHGRFLGLLSLPEPPAAAPKHAPEKAAHPLKVTPAHVRGVFQAPTRVPGKVAKTVDPDLVLQPLAAGMGVPGGTGDAVGGGNGVIQGFVRDVPLPRPPAPARTPEPAKTIPRVRMGGQVQLAKLISGPPPVYPPLARQARISGVVRLEAVIARDGAIMDLHTISGHPLLVQAALAAVKRWVFQPSYLNGEPVEVATEIEVNFKLE